MPRERRPKAPTPEIPNAESEPTEVPPTRVFVAPHGEGSLRLEALPHGVVASWLSRMTLRAFLERLGTEDELELDVSRSSPSSPLLPLGRLRDPASLSEAEAGSVCLVRADFDDAAVAWERVSEDKAYVAVIGESWRSVELYLARFIPASQIDTVADEIAEFAAAS